MGRDGKGAEPEMEGLLERPDLLIARIAERLGDPSPGETETGMGADLHPSVVLLVLGRGPDGPGLVLNKRSRMVPQPGDLCCPGGGMMPRTDAALSRLLFLPGSPLRRWPGWERLRERRPAAARNLARMAAAGLREAFEEMRLNPLRVSLLGPLPPERLRMFRRVIHPLAVWTDGRLRLAPNREVERIVRIPLRHLLDPAHYARFRVSIARNGDAAPEVREFPCVRFADAAGEEILWGATFRIVSAFLREIFEFAPPPPEALPRIDGRLNRDYMTGNGRGRVREFRDRPSRGDSEKADIPGRSGIDP
jgi:8-oxo-dGTP pyrophosphatase MutT (NUDIX family)